MKIIGLCGMPNSGKTTLINRLCQYLDSQKYKCESVVDAVRNSVIKPKGSFAYNLWGVIKQTEAILAKADSDLDFLFLDRCFHDTSVLAKALRETNLLSEIEYEKLTKIAHELSFLIDEYYLFLTPPSISLNRDEKHSSDKKGSIMNMRVLKAIYREYKRVMLDKASLVLYTEKNSLNECFSMVRDHIEKSHTGIHCVSPNVESHNSP